MGDDSDCFGSADMTGVGGHVQLSSKGDTCIGKGARTVATSNISSFGYHIAIGHSSVAGRAGTSGGCAIGIGRQVLAEGDFSIAIGSDSTTNTSIHTISFGDRSIAIGPGAQTDANSTKGISIGSLATCTVANGIAIGTGAQAQPMGAATSVIAIVAGDIVIGNADSPVVASAPGVATHQLQLMINGVKYAIALTPI
jgi:hypothetical protein